MGMIDTNHDVTNKLAALKSAGITTVIRYFNRRSPSGEKVVKPKEARAMASAGMRLGIVYEYNADVRTLTEPNGFLDCEWSLKYAPSIGMPHSLGARVGAGGPAIYFAVDFDPSLSSVAQNVIPYFKGIKRALGAMPWFRVGVYGSGTVCTKLKAQQLVSLTWVTQSMGFSGSRAYVKSGDADIIQRLPKIIAGLDTDPDDKGPNAKDIGDFLPVFT